MKLIFCGTPKFAVPALERLTSPLFEIELVVTNPDEPSGRGYGLKASPVKQVALDCRLPVFQPHKLKTPFSRAFLSEYRPDAIVVVAYGHILPGWMIALPRLGCINLHASLLPKYRGAAPIAWAIIRGEQRTGVTTMKIDAGLDTGDMLLAREVEIRSDDTTETLGERLSLVGAELIAETLERLDRGDIRPQLQDHSQATLAPMLKKQDGLINWLLSAEEIERRVRGLYPWPGAYTVFRRKGLQVWKSAVAAMPASTLQPGTLLGERGRLLAACGRGSVLELIEVQVEGRRSVSGRDFLNGIHLSAPEKLGAPES
ncbi:MAG TPA: methionyl-tRNA formyltransferase [Terriglobia bacterium]|nr:methionyl-tRNA formyltransferase [Terriglobia bacterium]